MNLWITFFSQIEVDLWDYPGELSLAIFCILMTLTSVLLREGRRS